VPLTLLQARPHGGNNARPYVASGMEGGKGKGKGGKGKPKPMK
jgi:hypothetical protein